MIKLSTNLLLMEYFLLNLFYKSQEKIENLWNAYLEHHKPDWYIRSRITSDFRYFKRMDGCSIINAYTDKTREYIIFTFNSAEI